MKVSIIHPHFWSQHGHWDYKYQTPGTSGRWKSIEYFFNSIPSDVDIVVVHDNVDRSLNVKSRERGVILVTGEEKSVLEYPQEFIDQFDCVITSRDDIKHPNQIRTHYFHPWRIKRTYDRLISDTPDKTKKLSAIISNLQQLPIQKKRFELIQDLKKMLGNDLDWFSKGQDTFLDDKYDGLAPYEYSIAIENSQHINYFTEKITDCFLCHTMPLYFGCPNIDEFFDDRSYISIDINSPEIVKEQIAGAISANYCLVNNKYLEESKRLVLDKYHFLASLHDALVTYDVGQTRVKKVIKPQQQRDTVFKTDNLLKSLWKVFQ